MIYDPTFFHGFILFSFTHFDPQLKKFFPGFTSFYMAIIWCLEVTIKILQTNQIWSTANLWKKFFSLTTGLVNKVAFRNYGEPGPSQMRQQKVKKFFFCDGLRERWIFFQKSLWNWSTPNKIQKHYVPQIWDWCLVYGFQADFAEWSKNICRSLQLPWCAQKEKNIEGFNRCPISLFVNSFSFGSSRRHK